MHNAVFDLIELSLIGRVASDRAPRLSLVHALSSERSPRALMVPVLIWLDGQSPGAVIAFDLALTVACTSCVCGFFLPYDQWRPVRR